MRCAFDLTPYVKIASVDFDETIDLHCWGFMEKDNERQSS